VGDLPNVNFQKDAQATSAVNSHRTSQFVLRVQCVRAFLLQKFTSRRFSIPAARSVQAKVSMSKSKPSDPWSIGVIVLTIALFILALFVKGFTKGLLVECGVLLVSIKLILMAKKTAVIEENLDRRLDRIEKLLSQGRDEKLGES
jgi:hypothetical protein